MRPASLAAILYEPGEGQTVDDLLANIAGQLAKQNVRLAGTIQRAAPRPDRCACDMIMIDLGSGDEIPISEDRGPDARGCRLDVRALETLVGSTAAALERGADLLIINKFGKREAEGAGFRQVIAAAASEGIPVLVAVNRDNAPAWRAFAGDLGVELVPEEAALQAWCEATLERDEIRASDGTSIAAE